VIALNRKEALEVADPNDPRQKGLLKNLGVDRPQLVAELPDGGRWRFTADELRPTASRHYEVLLDGEVVGKFQTSEEFTIHWYDDADDTSPWR
jgi:hypothetical protein